MLRTKKDARFSVVCYYTPGVNNTKLMASLSSELWHNTWQSLDSFCLESVFMVLQHFVYLPHSARWQGILIRETKELVDLFSSLVLVILREYILGQDFLFTWWRGQHGTSYGVTRKEENVSMMGICLWNAAEISGVPLRTPAQTFVPISPSLGLDPDHWATARQDSGTKFHSGCPK